MNYPNLNNAILQEITTAEWQHRNLSVFVKRDDLIHDEISGNKWRKLLYNVEQAKFNKNETIITFGGAFSNHLVATACASNLLGFKSIGIVRGEELNENSNDTLKRCAAYGMQLIFVTRNLYQFRYDKEWWKELHTDFPNSYIVPEGGANYYGMLGCQEIWSELPKDIDRLFVAQGTTTTSCGILLGSPTDCKVHVVPVLKGFNAKKEMQQLFQQAFLDTELVDDCFERLVVEDEYHFGGYGKYTQELINYITSKYHEFSLKIDPIYTAKAFYALESTIQKLDLVNEKIVFIHTGGIQGGREIALKGGVELYIRNVKVENK